MKKEIFRVGVYIEDEFTEFATCTTIESAKRAKELLEKAGWGEEDEDEDEDDCCGVVIEKSNLYLDSIEIDGIEYDLTTN